MKGVAYLDIDLADPILKQAQIKTRYISGIGKLNDQLILLPDLASLLDDAKLNKQEEKCWHWLICWLNNVQLMQSRSGQY